MGDTYWLVAVEVAHIQSYIFKSNRLRENVGASQLVADATGLWALQATRTVADGHCNVSEAGELIVADEPQYYIDGQNDTLAEVIYAGGGNFVVLFKTESLAQAFATELSEMVIARAPNLHLNLKSQAYEWVDNAGDEKSLANAINTLKRELSAQRSQNPPDIGLAGLSVTVMGASTSLPAVWVDTKTDHGTYSAETMGKRAAFDDANKRLEQSLELGNDYRYPLDFDDLGRSEGDTSYVAVVHADGNGMGAMFRGIGDGKNNRDYIRALRQRSEETKDIAREALHQTVVHLKECIYQRFVDNKYQRYIPNANQTKNQVDLVIEYDKKEGQYVLPFRPLVSGGDDVTFVCDGRLGLSLAAYFVEQFETVSEEILGSKLTAGVGVAIVKSHYPFARSYDLAEELITNAKRLLHRERVVQTHSSIDWHVTTTGLYGSLETMREREYEVPSGSLTHRPMMLTPHNNSRVTWQEFKEIIGHFQTDWAESRNKAKQLVEVLREGRGRTRLFAQRYLIDSELTLPPIADFERALGWIDDRCGYFDALEMLDLYYPLIPVAEPAAT